MSLPRHFVLATLAVSLAALQTIPAEARSRPAPSRAVEIEAADLASPERAEALHRRIEAAAFDVCRAENRHGADYARSVRLCTAETLARTVERIGAPVLTAVHRERAEPLRLASQAGSGAF